MIELGEADEDASSEETVAGSGSVRSLRDLANGAQGAVRAGSGVLRAVEEVGGVRAGVGVSDTTVKVAEVGVPVPDRCSAAPKGSWG